MTGPTTSSLIAGLRGQLIVSCQAYPGEPLRDPVATSLIARSACLGGAAAIRAQGLDDIRLVHEAVDVPQIGLWKVGSAGVFITPTVEHALAVAKAGAEIVAIDGTRRSRPDGRTLAETVTAIRSASDVLIMADIGCVDDGLAARDAGVDLIGTTLAGYTDDRAKTAGPDLALVESLVPRVDLPVLAEGRIHTPEQARQAIECGAFAVVVGTAITHPATITSWFAQSVREATTDD